MGKKVIVDLPDQVNLEAAEVIMMIAAHLYDDGRLSLGQAADLVHLDKRTFAERLGKYKVSIFNSPIEDILRDVRNA